jgi:hypothetical protein
LPAGKTPLKKRDSVTRNGIRQHYAGPMIKPISLKLRPDETTRRARAMLRRFDKEMAAQQRVKWCALRALSEIYEMDSAAEVKLKSMSSSARDSWHADYKLLVDVLRRIQKRGV